MKLTRLMKALALAAAGALAFTGCAAPGATPDETAGTQTTVTVTDNTGEHTITVPPRSVVATDNRLFETLADWDIQLAAAPRNLIPTTNKFRDDESIVNLGSHNEPDLEAVVAVEPDLIINGQRFAQFADKFADLVPDATIINLDPREGEPFDGELKRGVTVLGEIFGKQAQAAELGSELDAQVARVKAAYDPADKVIAVNVSGGKIGFIAPGVGRALGPLYDVLGLTPALEVDNSSSGHMGDDISVEAIAQSNPDWILVMDRDAAISSAEATYQPAQEVISGSEALQGVNAIRDGNVIFMPSDTYTNEGIQTYTEFLSAFADALEGKN